LDAAPSVLSTALLEIEQNAASYKALISQLPQPPPSGGGGVIPGVFKNVMDAPYSAKGDGTTDDTASINGAIQDVFNLGGGTVFFPRPASFYLCNGSFDSTTNSILKIPKVDALTQNPRQIQLLGEQLMWGTYDGDGIATIIKTTRNDGGGTGPALLAGNAASLYGNSIDPRSHSQLRLVIRNLRFDLQDNSTIWGLRMDSIGMAILEDVGVLSGATPNTHGAIGIHMPNYVTMSQSQCNRILSFGWDVGLAAAELLIMPWSYLSNCNVGFRLKSGGAPRILVNCDTCNTGIQIVAGPPTYAGQSAMDCIYQHEHNTAHGALVYDIDDGGNMGGGVIRYLLSQASVVGYNQIAPTINGGANINIIPATGKQFTIRQPTYATPTDQASTVACLRAAGLCA
jgi:hypothetical protein